MKRGEIERQAPQLRPIPDRNLWYAEIDLELRDLNGIVIDAIAEAALLVGIGAGARDAARAHGVDGRRTIALVDFEGEHAAQVIAGDEVEETPEARAPPGFIIMGARCIVITILA